MERVCLEQGKRGIPTIRVDMVPPRYLHSVYDPLSEAKKVVDGWDLCAPSRVVIVGLGLGYHVSECLKRFPSVKIEVIEGNAQVVALARRVNGTLFHNDNVNIHSVRSEEDFAKLFARFDSNEVRLHPASAECFPFPAVRTILQEMQALMSSTRLLSENLVENYHKNVQLLDPTTVLSGHKGIWRGRPGVLVAAGPSLGSILPIFSSTIPDESVVFCVSRTMELLLSHQIDPTAAVVTESSPEVIKHVRNLKSGTNIPLFCVPTVPPGLVEAYSGPITWVLQDGFRETEEFAQKYGCDTFPTGASVATLTLALLYYFGCDPIVFVGQDLAFVEQRTHVDEGSSNVDYTRPWILETDSVHGKRVNTTITWNIFRHWIESFIDVHSDRTYLNASEGARIRGTKYVPFESLTTFLTSK